MATVPQRLILAASLSKQERTRDLSLLDAFFLLTASGWCCFLGSWRFGFPESSKTPLRRSSTSSAARQLCPNYLDDALAHYCHKSHSSFLGSHSRLSRRDIRFVSHRITLDSWSNASPAYWPSGTQRLMCHDNVVSVRILIKYIGTRILSSFYIPKFLY